jgi:hypothetical protein
MDHMQVIALFLDMGSYNFRDGSALALLVGQVPTRRPGDSRSIQQKPRGSSLPHVSAGLFFQAATLTGLP